MAISGRVPSGIFRDFRSAEGHRPPRQGKGGAQALRKVGKLLGFNLS